MSTRASKTFTKHFSETLPYDLSFADWLARNNTSQGTVAVTVPDGLMLVHTEANGVVHMVISGGTAGTMYEVVVLMTSANGLVRRASVYISVQGIIGVSNPPVAPPPSGGSLTAALIVNGTATSVGAGIARAGSNWVYALVLESTSPGATATIQIRVGSTPDASLNFDTLTLTTTSVLQSNGKYRAVGSTFGSLVWPYHAADILAISGAGATVNVTGNGN